MKTETTEQPLPTPGEGDVMQALAELVLQRRAKGIETYGRSLQTFNGRSAERDLVEELVDGAAYALQARLERAKLEARVIGLENECGALRMQISALRACIATDKLRLEVDAILDEESTHG